MIQSRRLLRAVCLLVLLFAVTGLRDQKAEAEHRAQVFGGEKEPEPSRRDIFISEKLAIEREVVGAFRNIDVPEANEIAVVPNKVSFIFLTMDELALPRVWDKFFDGADPSRYSIFVHRAKKNLTTAIPLERFGAIQVPWVQTSWCSLFGVEVAALAAALQDPSNTQFVFVSESSVPLKRFQYVYAELVEKSPATSKFCFGQGARHNHYHAEFVSSITNGICFFKDFYRRVNPRTLKHHQWAVLSRTHAAAVLRQSSKALDIYEDSWRKVTPDLKAMPEGCSDESVPITALLAEIEARDASVGNTWGDLTRMGVEQQCLTFVEWRSCFAGSDLEMTNAFSGDVKKVWHSKRDVMKLLIGKSSGPLMARLKGDLNGFPHTFVTVKMESLRRLVKEGFMFARKFESKVIVTGDDVDAPPRDIADVLSELWNDVDEKVSRANVWARLDTLGKPDPMGRWGA